MFFLNKGCQTKFAVFDMHVSCRVLLEFISRNDIVFDKHKPLTFLQVPSIVKSHKVLYLHTMDA